MKKQISEYQPILIQKTQETEEIMKQVIHETAEADKQKLQVQEDEVITMKKAEDA